jgi:hypothetical protein
MSEFIEGANFGEIMNRPETLSLQIAGLHQPTDTVEQMDRINKCRARAHQLRLQRDELMQVAARLFSIVDQRVAATDPERATVDSAAEVIRRIAGDPA